MGAQKVSPDFQESVGKSDTEGGKLLRLGPCHYKIFARDILNLIFSKFQNSSSAHSHREFFYDVSYHLMTSCPHEYVFYILLAVVGSIV